MKNRKGITLISLVVTVIILIILATVSILTITGEGGILQKTVKGEEENKKQTATEKINLKITTIQINTYAEKQKMPSLQELADGLCEDENDEIEYVFTKSQKKQASLDKIQIKDEDTSIFTKLREYPYEFEINRSLQLASIDGIKIADVGGNTVSREEYDALKVRLEKLEREQEYHVGDTIKYGNILIPGILTTSGTQLICTLLLGKDISSEVTKIEFSTSAVNIRAGGKYLINSVYTDNCNMANYFQAKKEGSNAIRFYYVAPSAFAATNNTPINFELTNLMITFK